MFSQPHLHPGTCPMTRIIKPSEGFQNPLGHSRVIPPGHTQGLRPEQRRSTPHTPHLHSLPSPASQTLSWFRVPTSSLEPLHQLPQCLRLSLYPQGSHHSLLKTLPRTLVQTERSQDSSAWVLRPSGIWYLHALAASSPTDNPLHLPPDTLCDTSCLYTSCLPESCGGWWGGV